MEATSSTETLVDFQLITGRYIPKEKLHNLGWVYVLIALPKSVLEDKCSFGILFKYNLGILFHKLSSVVDWTGLTSKCILHALQRLHTV
jgi:hypothetical protein